jgi:hypothetical protein
MAFTSLLLANHALLRRVSLTDFGSDLVKVFGGAVIMSFLIKHNNPLLSFQAQTLVYAQTLTTTGNTSPKESRAVRTFSSEFI